MVGLKLIHVKGALEVGRPIALIKRCGLRGLFSNRYQVNQYQDQGMYK